jgi:peptidyl-prolyl cis-trans isomerase SurA
MKAMMRHILFAMGLLLVLQAVPVFIKIAGAQTLRIAAVVNDEAISMTDVEERMKLVMISSGLPDSKEIRSKIMPQVVEGLIEEQLKLQEAARNNLTVSEAEMESGFATIAAQNNLTMEQFRMAMKQSGVPVKTLEHQIRAQLAWTNVVKAVYRSQVNVTSKDVDSRIARMKTNLGKTEYLVSEIFLPFDNSKRASELADFANRMAKELQAKRAPFGPVAAQFSKAAGAENGGSLGWIQEGHLSPDLEKVLLKLEEGQVSDPIRTPGGIYLLQLQKKRTLTEEGIPPREELTNQIGFERLDRVQQKALLDLKSSAFIDRRV